MTAAERRRLTERVLAVEGVRGVFPPSTLAAAAAVVQAAADAAAPALVEVSRRNRVVVVTARLAVDVRTPSAEVVAAVRRAVAAEFGDRPARLRLEIASIE